MSTAWQDYQAGLEAWQRASFQGRAGPREKRALIAHLRSEFGAELGLDERTPDSVVELAVYQHVYMPRIEDPLRRADAQLEFADFERKAIEDYQAERLAQPQVSGRPTVMPESHPVVYFGQEPPPPPPENNGPSLEELDARRHAAGARLQAAFDAEGPDGVEDAVRGMGNPFGGG